MKGLYFNEAKLLTRGTKKKSINPKVIIFRF